MASNETIKQVINILRYHLTEAQIKAILEDLLKVPGNKSFTDTIKALARIARGT
jgi:hypothetical protein